MHAHKQPFVAPGGAEDYITRKGVQNGDTEVAVKADDGTIVHAAAVVLIKAGETATVTIKVPADQTETVETPPPMTEPAATAQAAVPEAMAPAQTNAKQTAGIPNLTTDPHGQNGLNRYESMQEDTKGEKLRYKTKAFVSGGVCTKEKPLSIIYDGKPLKQTYRADFRVIR